MTNHTSLADIHRQFFAVGNAIMRVNGNNTHSGNISVRDPDNTDIFYITASGSQCGALTTRDIVPVRFSSVSWGDARASSESTIHRQILNIPGVNACLHAHPIVCTVLTFDDSQKQVFLRYLDSVKSGQETAIFQPVDFFGAGIIGGVKVGYYKQPVGSPEMEKHIPQRLADSAITLVRGHGPFIRGKSLAECLHYLSILENSASIALYIKRRGMDLGRIQQKIIDHEFESLFPRKPHALDVKNIATRQIKDQSTITDFTYWLAYNYNFGICAYGVGSMSIKVTADEMIFCPMAAVPNNMDFPLYRVALAKDQDDDHSLTLHKLIYNHTQFTTCMITSSPMATAEGMATLADAYGIQSLLGNSRGIVYESHHHPVIIPIDAEAIYLNPRLGLVDISHLSDKTADNPILNMLRWHKGCCVIAGYGVVAVGDTTLEQAAHNVASAERIGRFRMEVFANEKMLNAAPLQSFEPRTI